MHRNHHIRRDRVGRYGPRNAEIGQFYLSVRGNNDILRFDIAVYNVAVMSSFQPQRNLNRNTGRLFDA